MSRFFFFCFFLGISSPAISQGCFGFEKENCKPSPSKFAFKYHDKSGAFKFTSGELRRIPINLIQNKDYRITICGESIFNGIISFVIKDSQGINIYDNSNHSFALNFEFSAKKSQDVFFELTIPDISNNTNEQSSLEGCVGILIEEMNTIKTGF